jgi:hypothetical protein
LLELAHQQAEEVEPGPLRLEELVQKEAAFGQIFFSVKDFIRELLD